MVDENSAASVLAQHDPNAHLAAENRELRARLAALESANVVDGGFRGEAPRYQLNEPGFYDDTLFAAGSVLEYTDTPNLTMVPLNEPAQRAMDAYLRSLTESGRRAAAMRNREFVGLVTDRGQLLEQALEDAKAAAAAAVPVVEAPKPYGSSVPAMPHTEDALAAQRRGPGRPRKVISAVAPSAKPDAGAPVLAPSANGPAIVGRMVSK